MSSSGSERSLFLGSKIPPEVKSLCSNIGTGTLTEKAFKGLLQLAIKDCAGDIIEEGVLDKIEHKLGKIPDVEINYAGILSIVKSAMRMPVGSLKVENFKEDLNHLKLPPNLVADMAALLYGPRRAELERKNQKNCPHLPTFKELRWKLDVTISSSSLSKVLEPTLVFEMSLNNGQSQVFEVPIAKFHQLRYDVANILKDMGDLEKRSILKI